MYLLDTVTIAINWTGDDDIERVLLNGVVVASYPDLCDEQIGEVAGCVWGVLHAVSIASGFVSGRNTLEFETRNVRCTTNPMGVKGAGEAGTIGATPAAMNAVVDALYRGYGIKSIDMPATPLNVWQAIQAGAAQGHSKSGSEKTAPRNSK